MPAWQGIGLPMDVVPCPSGILLPGFPWSNPKWVSCCLCLEVKAVELNSHGSRNSAACMGSASGWLLCQVDVFPTAPIRPGPSSSSCSGRSRGLAFLAKRQQRWVPILLPQRWGGPLPKLGTFPRDADAADAHLFLVSQITEMRLLKWDVPH